MEVPRPEVQLHSRECLPSALAHEADEGPERCKRYRCHAVRLQEEYAEWEPERRLEVPGILIRNSKAEEYRQQGRSKRMARAGRLRVQRRIAWE